MTTTLTNEQTGVTPLVQEEFRHGGIVVLHVQAGIAAERRASLLVEVLERHPSQRARKVLMAFTPGTELCCTSLWALSRLADRCASEQGSLGVVGVGDATLKAAKQAGLASRFVAFSDVDEGVARLASSEAAGRGKRKLLRRAA